MKKKYLTLDSPILKESIKHFHQNKIRDIRYAERTLSEKEKEIEKQWRREAVLNNKLIFETYREQRRQAEEEAKKKLQLCLIVKEELLRLRSEMVKEGYPLWRDLPWLNY